MITIPEIVIEDVASVCGEVVVDNTSLVEERQLATTGFRSRTIVKDGTSLFDLCLCAAKKVDTTNVAGVIAATFSNENRFPSLAVQLASALGLPAETPAFDLQMACSAYPYALFVAGQLAAAAKRPILVVHGDIQSRLVDKSDAATNFLFSDAAAATLVTANTAATSQFAALSKASDALICAAMGPIRMDGFKVFSFVAQDVLALLKQFAPTDYEVFVPHQANLYMVRQLAKALGAKESLISVGRFANPGGCSIPLMLDEKKTQLAGKKALLAGFGAGLSAAALTVRVATKDVSSYSVSRDNVI